MYRTLAMFAAALGTVGCAAPTPTAPSSDEAITGQAARCGLKPNQLVWGIDAAGQRTALVTPNGDLDNLTFQSLKCMLEWADANGARVSFVAQPPPKP